MQDRRLVADQHDLHAVQARGHAGQDEATVFAGDRRVTAIENHDGGAGQRLARDGGKDLSADAAGPRRLLRERRDTP